MLGFRCLAGAALAFVLAVGSVSAQPAAPFLQVQVAGPVVTGTWAPTFGAVSYRAEAGISPTQALLGYELGGATSFTVNAPAGTYYLRVVARDAQGRLTSSNIVVVNVSAGAVPPPAPQNVQASVSDATVNLSVGILPGGSSGLALAAGYAPGQTLTVVPLPYAPQMSIPNVPPGTYYARLHAVGVGGISGPSNELAITVAPSACAPLSSPTVQASASGSSVSVSWSPVSGAAAYQLIASMSPGGPAVATQDFPPSITSTGFNGVPAGTYYLRVVTANSCGSTITSADASVTVAPAPGGGTSGPRTPNPPSPTPPNYIPLPNRASVVDEIARAYPGDLRNSCRDTGGNNIWLFRLVERLRREDTRWGLNWKRANVGDMSQDIITYNFGPETDEGTLFVHAVDVINGHCGSNPQPTWNNVTVLFSTGAKWTLQPYLQAGFPQYPQ